MPNSVRLLLLIATVGLLASADERLLRHRNLGKAFYENPATQLQAVDEFRKALELNPKSPAERLNYGLALLRAGKTAEGIAEIEKVQKQDPSIPHTWFNLGVQFRKQGEAARAVEQWEKMVALVPDEPVSQYNLGASYKLAGRIDDAVRHFEIAARLDPNLAAPHFQLFNAYRASGRQADAARELQIFQRLKKEQEGAAIPEDMEWSLYAEIYEKIETLADATAPATLKFQDRALPGKVDVRTAGLITLDADGDAKLDLLAYSTAGLRLYRGGTDAAEIAGVTGVTSVAPGDFDNDGFTDLAVTTAGGPLLLRNAKGKFTRHASANLPAGRFEKALWVDYDHDYDLDLFLLGAASKLMRNQGAAGFADRTADFAFGKGHIVDAVAFRLIADTKGFDFAVSLKDTSGVLYRDKLGGMYAPEPLTALPPGATALVAYDADNDGEVDVAFSSEGQARWMANRGGNFETLALGAGSRFVFADLENRGAGDFVTTGGVARNLGLRKFASGSAPAGFVGGEAWAEGDFDGDGRADLATVGADGSVHLLINQTASRNGWLRIKLAGVKNLKLAYGAEVEIKAGELYQKKLYAGTALAFGVRSNKEVDTVRITWPNGLIQNEPKQAAGRAFEYKEAQRLSGSCPMIWTWNGREFVFVTDVLGVAPLGASAGDGRYFPVDHDEYIQIPAGALVERDGQYEVRITEELSEVAYLDKIALMAVDHPADTEIFLNDKFKAPPFPEFRLYGANRRVYPVRASQQGRNVLTAVRTRDRRYPDHFKRTLAGVAEEWAIELNFGVDAARDNRAVLVLNGWVDWADGSTFLSTAQERRGGLTPPYLQVKDERGEWRTVIEDMGMPAGKPKTIAVDLTGRFLSASREVRIVTNLCVYWDEIFMSENSSEPEARLTSVAPLGDLRFRGFSPVVIHPERKQPEHFLYPAPRPASMWNQTPGLYTRYGDVTELLETGDDRFVIMGSGDELRLRFDKTGLPALARGWTRDFVLLVDGWAKDRDANTAFSQTVEPLPFHSMSAYPFPEGEAYPETVAHREYRARYNSRPALRPVPPLRPGTSRNQVTIGGAQ